MNFTYPLAPWAIKCVSVVRVDDLAPERAGVNAV